MEPQLAERQSAPKCRISAKHGSGCNGRALGMMRTQVIVNGWETEWLPSDTMID